MSEYYEDVPMDFVGYKGDSPDLDFGFGGKFLGGPSGVNAYGPSGQIQEPPPGGYPKIIVHPERPDAGFALISDGWYRSPTGEVVPYRTVAEYVLSGSGDRTALLKAIGQIPSGVGGNTWLYVAGGVILFVVLLSGRRR